MDNKPKLNDLLNMLMEMQIDQGKQIMLLTKAVSKLIDNINDIEEKLKKKNKTIVITD